MTLLAVTLAAVVSFLEGAHDGSTIGLFGAPQTGKSYSLKTADAAKKLKRRRVVFDPYARRDKMLFERGLKKSPPWPGVWCEADDLVFHPEDLLDADTVRVVVAPRTLDPAELGKMFTRTFEACWAAGDIDLIAEEAGLYSRRARDAMMQLASGGSHALMRLYAVSQSIGRLDKDARRHLSHVVAFAQGETTDLDDLRKRCGRSFAERVQRLNPQSGLAETWKLGEGLGV